MMTFKNNFNDKFTKVEVNLKRITSDVLPIAYIKPYLYLTSGVEIV